MAEMRSEKQLQLYREVLPMLLILDNAFQKNAKLSGDYFSKLYKITTALKPSYSEYGYDQWDKIVGSPDSSWQYRSESTQYDVDTKVKNFSTFLLSYLKGIVDADEARKSSDSLRQLIKEIAIVREQLAKMLDRLTVHLPSEEKIGQLNQKVEDLRSKLGQLQSKFIQPTVSPEIQNMRIEQNDMRITQLDGLVEDARKELEELRKQHTILLRFLVKEENAPKISAVDGEE